MNKLLVSSVLFLSLLFTVSQSQAQTYVAKFCRITRLRKGMNNKWFASYVSTGNQPGLSDIKDSTEFIALQKVAGMTDEIDVLDYMYSIGWWLFNPSSAASGNQDMIFEKQFDKRKQLIEEKGN